MKPVSFAVITGLIAGALLAGCGNGQDSAAAPTPTPAGPPPIVNDLARKAVPPGGVISTTPPAK